MVIVAMEMSVCKTSWLRKKMKKVMEDRCINGSVQHRELTRLERNVTTK